MFANPPVCKSCCMSISYISCVWFYFFIFIMEDWRKQRSEDLDLRKLIKPTLCQMTGFRQIQVCCFKPLLSISLSGICFVILNTPVRLGKHQYPVFFQLCLFYTVNKEHDSHRLYSFFPFLYFPKKESCQIPFPLC